MNYPEERLLIAKHGIKVTLTIIHRIGAWIVAHVQDTLTIHNPGTGTLCAGYLDYPWDRIPDSCTWPLNCRSPVVRDKSTPAPL